MFHTVYHAIRKKTIFNLDLYCSFNRKLKQLGKIKTFADSQPGLCSKHVLKILVNLSRNVLYLESKFGSREPAQALGNAEPPCKRKTTETYKKLF